MSLRSVLGAAAFTLLGSVPALAQSEPAWNSYALTHNPADIVSSTEVAAALAGKVDVSRIGVAGGVAGLSNTGVTSACPGVAANGTTNDTAALQTCKNNAAANTIIRLPAGDMNVTAFPTGSNAVLWYDNGTTFNGGNPVTAIGTDVIESVLSGGKYFARGNSVANGQPIVRVDGNFTHTGGTAGAVMSDLHLNCTIPSEGAALNNYIWCNQTILTSSASGAGQHVAIDGTVFRPSNALTDGLGPRAQTWGGYFENNDQTNSAANLAGSQVGVEDDIYANGLSPTPFGRINLQLELAQSNTSGAAAEGTAGIAIGTNDSVSYYDTPIKISAPYSVAGIDLSAGTPVSGAPAIRLGTNNQIDFSSNGTHTLGYIGSGPVLQYAVSGTGVWKVDNNGNSTQIGGVTANTLTTSSNAYVGGYVRPIGGVDWEVTSVITTSYASGALTEYNGSTALRSVNTSTGNETFLGSLTPSTTGGIVGTTSANNANAGSVGEYLSATNSSGTTMVTATPINLTSLTLTPGDWDVNGSGQITCTGGATYELIGANTTSATVPSFGQYASIGSAGGSTALYGATMALPSMRFNVSASTTIYAVGTQTCSSGTLTGYAMLSARRVR